MKALLKFTFFTCLTLFGHKAFSQVRSNFANTSNLTPAQKLNIIRETYIENQMKLSDEEKTKFRLLYRKYNNEINEVRKLKNQNLVNNNSKDQMQKDLQYSQQLLDIKKQYTQEFLKFLPADKVNRIYLSEKEFIAEAINQLGDPANSN